MSNKNIFSVNNNLVNNIHIKNLDYIFKSNLNKSNYNHNNLDINFSSTVNMPNIPHSSYNYTRNENCNSKKLHSQKISFSIIGMGRFGQALANVLSNASGVKLRTYDIQNPNLHTVLDLPKEWNFSETLEQACFLEKADSLSDIHWIVPAVPAAIVSEIVEKIYKLYQDNLPSQKLGVLLVSKGTDASGNFVMNVLQHKYPDIRIASFAGPHFANELVKSTSNVITTIGCKNEDKHSLQKAFAAINPFFTEDILGVQISSIMKNVTAFCCGMAQGLQLGENTRATVFGLCLQETRRLLTINNCDHNTAYASPLLADLVLTATSPTSRNYKAGYDTAISAQKECNLVESIKSSANLLSYLNKTFGEQYKWPFIEFVASACSNNNNLESSLNKSINMSLSMLQIQE